MQNSNEIIFKFKNFELKPVIDSSGNPWFK